MRRANCRLNRSAVATREWAIGNWQLAILVPALLIGCESSSSSGSSMKDRQDSAMKDPFGYGPVESRGKTQVEEPKKRDDSLKGEWDRFWNP